MPPLTLRWADASDYDELGKVMYEAVRTGGSPYSDAQRSAWVSEPRSGQKWNERLAKQHIILAETNDQIVGFMSLAENEYLDFAYILPNQRGTGLFRQFYDQIELRAVELGCSRIWVHASLMAEPAFTGMGFEKLSRERIPLNDQELDRFVMEKQISQKR